MTRTNTLGALPMDYKSTLLDDYKETRECEYKGERYSVRDNGAVFRHAKTSKPRKYDEVWTFGKANSKGYMTIASVRVHIIVAKAFLGNPEQDNYVVDHIDTNKQNNRPTNLRWVSRLDNIINNPITKTKIEIATGLPIEEVLKDISILQRTFLPNDISWMRAVSQKDADHSLKAWKEWIEKKRETPGYPNISNFRKEEIHIPISQETDYSSNPPVYIREGEIPTTDSVQQYEKERIKERPNPNYPYSPSRTPGVLLDGWKPDGDFLLCPTEQEEHSLLSYYKKIKSGKIIYRNDYGHELRILDAEVSLDGKTLMVKSWDEIAVKQRVLITITMGNGMYVHKRYPFFDDIGLEKYYTLGLGKDWTGGDCIDDYC